MIIISILYISTLCFAEWVEIPFMKPNTKQFKEQVSVYHRETTTKATDRPLITFPIVTDRILFNNFSNNSSSITIIPQKTSIKEVFGTYGQLTTQKPEHNVTEKPIIIKIEEDTIEPKVIADEQVKQSKIDNIFTGYNAFLSLLKTVQSNLLKTAHKSVKSKMEILTNLRDNLLINIDQRMRQLWPIEENSQTREYEESHVDFPSNEGALITIGFLTLAVFLVKLVLQVIQVIKTKKMYYNTTGPATFTSFGRKRRSLDPENTYKILELIENYNFTP